MIKNFKQWKKINESEDDHWLPSWVPDFVKKSIPKEIPNFPKNKEDIPIFIYKLMALNPLGIPISMLFNLASEVFLGSEKSTKLRLVFIKGSWEKIATDFLKEFGVITFAFKTIKQAIEQIGFLKTKGKKFLEIALISHEGEEWENMMSKSDGSGKSFYNFMYSMRPILQPNTVIYFTACNSKDYLMQLVDAANAVNQTVSGAVGVHGYFDIIMSSAEKGYYSARPLNAADQEKIKKKYPDLSVKAIPNKVLLEFGICKKLTKAPISWLEI